MFSLLRFGSKKHASKAKTPDKAKNT